MNSAMASKSNVQGAIQPPPVLSDSHHSGISQRLLEEAKASKSRLYSNRTVPSVTARKGELPVLPPDTTREQFNAAIDELQKILGSRHVVLNDRPLEDGWYIEHP